jgi:hypothetical protein
MEENCIGSQSPQLTVVLEKKKNKKKRMRKKGRRRTGAPHMP